MNHSTESTRSLPTPSDIDRTLFQLTQSDPLIAALYSPREQADALRRYWQELRYRKPLLPVDEILQLKSALAALPSHGGQILQLGDCVELLSECHPEHFQKRLAFIDSIRNYAAFRLRAPIVAIGRLAGQFAKPRSQFYEQSPSEGSKPIPSFFGEMINGKERDPWSRTPLLERLLWAHEAAQIGVQALADFRANNAPIYSSHEALNLMYDGAQTLPSPCGGTFNRSCHLPWLGMRQTYLGSGHISYIQHVDNPVAAKIGPETCGDTLAAVVRAANPSNQLGKLILISRFGRGKAQHCLPPLLERIAAMGAQVLWIIDPMHGNTQKNRHGLKFRAVDDLCQEISETIAIHKAFGSRNSGLHLETSPNGIQECCALSSAGDSIVAGPRYQSGCDPRLDYEQTIAVVHHYFNTLLS